jgi:hypothetical protein
MSVKYKRYHRKGKKVLAHFKPGIVVKAKTFNMYHVKYTYLLFVKLDDDTEAYPYFPQDVEELTINKL